MSDSNPGDVYKLYHYNPSIPVAAVAAGLFAIVTSIHCWLMVRTRAWFLIPLILGGVFELGGFAIRAYSASETPDWSLIPFILQSVLTLVAPALFAGSIYMILGKIILMTDGESHSMIRRTRLTKIFVTGDVLSFMVQSGGAGMMSTASLSKTGEYIVIGGLIIQIVIFGFFVAVASVFHIRMLKVPTSRVLTIDLPWQRHLYALYGSSALILIRSIFRVIEFAQGNSGYLFSNEVFMYVFDALLMILVLCVFIWIRPGEIRGIIDRVEKEDLESRDSRGAINLESYHDPNSPTPMKR